MESSPEPGKVILMILSIGNTFDSALSRVFISSNSDSASVPILFSQI